MVLPCHPSSALSVRCRGEEDGIADDCSCPFLPFFSAELRWLNCRKGCAATVLSLGFRWCFHGQACSECSSLGVQEWCASPGVLCCWGQCAVVTEEQGALLKGKVWRQCTTAEHTPTLCFFLPAAGEHFSFYCSLPVLLFIKPIIS